MKSYTANDHVFSESIQIVEHGDFITPESANSAIIQLLKNDMAICDMIFNQDAIDEAFNEVFGKKVQSDTQELSEEQVEQLVSTPWDGESDSDPQALTSEQIEQLVSTPWDGEGDSDPQALNPSEIESILNV